MRVPTLLLILTLCSATASESRAPPSELDEVTTNSLEDQLAQDRQGKERTVIEKSNYFAPNTPLIGRRVGQTVKLKCRSRRYKLLRPFEKKNLMFSWSKDGKDIDKDTHRRFEKYVLRGRNLEIDNAREGDSGMYKCEARLSNNTLNDPIVYSKDFAVSIIPHRAHWLGADHKIFKSVSFGNQTAVVGNMVKLECPLAKKNFVVPPIIQFYKYRSSIDPSRASPFSCDNTTERYLLQEGTIKDFVISQVQLNDSGWYSCRVVNEHINKFTKCGYLQVVAEELKSERSRPGTSNRQITMRLEAVILVALGISSVFLVTVLIIAFMCRKYRRERRKKKMAGDAFRNVYHWTKVVLIERQKQSVVPEVTIEKRKCLAPAPNGKFKNGVDVGDVENQLESEYLFLKPDRKWEFDRTHLQLRSELGQGEFGRVVLGTVSAALPNSTEHALIDVRGTVAIKMLKEGHSDQDMADFVKEMEIMKRIGSHPNIINLLGVCTQPPGKPLFLIVEYAKHKNLKGYLTYHRQRRLEAWDNAYERPLSHPTLQSYHDDPIDLKEMLNIGYQVAKGMMFLATKKCLHRDLAARNILVTENMTYKIADFGLARDVKTTEYYRKKTGGRLPVKWMSPEAIFDSIYTTESDVWSFGILLWEIVTLGDTPYKNLSVEEVCEWHKVGRRMERPHDCPESVYDVMRNCWSLQPADRPSWKILVNVLQALYIEVQENVYLEASPFLPSPTSPSLNVF